MDQRVMECLQGRQGSYILPFFWQHGEEHEVLLQELEAIAKSNVREFCVESRVHERFCQDAWWEDFGFLLREAQKRDMKVWLLDDKRFPTGYANGLTAQYPALRRRGIREEHVDVAGPMRQAAVIVSGRYRPEKEQLLSVCAYRRSAQGDDGLEGEGVDLTGCVHDGLLYWDIPEGMWRIFFIIDTGVVPQVWENYIDMLNPDSCALMIKAVYQPHYDHFSAYFGNTFQGFFSDEPCFANHEGHYYAKVGTPGLTFPWRGELMPRLAGQMGISAGQLQTLLPALWFDCGGQTSYLRQCYMDTITKLYSENFGWMLGNWCRDHGVQYIGHVIEDMNAHMRTGYGAGHYFRALDGQDMAGMDVVLNQLVPGMDAAPHTACIAGGKADPAFFTYTLAKMAASHSHLQPLKKGRAMCEIFGAFGWAEGLPMMKRMADHMLASGINHFVPHAFNPRVPDEDCPPYFYHRGLNPQYPLFGRLMLYMQRVSHVMSGGIHRASVAVLYNAQAEWAGGEYMLFQKPCKELSRGLIDFDIVHEDLLEREDIAVHGGWLQVGEERFGAIIVPYSQYLPYGVLKRLAHLAQQGARVWFVEGLCDRASEGQSIDAFNSAFQVVPLDELVGCLRREGIFEIETQTPCPDLRFYHVHRGESDLYFFYNQSNARAVHTQLKLPNSGDFVWYDAFDNTLSAASAPQGRLTLGLAPGNACVAVFSDEVPAELLHPLPAWMTPAAPDDVVGVLSDARYVISLRPAGAVDFAPYQEEAALFNLASPQGDPRFCGDIRYEMTWQLPEQIPAGRRLLLDLGCVGETAQVFLNGVDCGVRIQAPYCFDISRAVQVGENRLTVQVTNNRGYLERDMFSRFLPLAPVGLLGPVTLRETM